MQRQELGGSLQAAGRRHLLLLQRPAVMRGERGAPSATGGGTLPGSPAGRALPRRPCPAGPLWSQRARSGPRRPWRCTWDTVLPSSSAALDLIVLGARHMLTQRPCPRPHRSFDAHASGTARGGTASRPSPVPSFSECPRLRSTSPHPPALRSRRRRPGGTSLPSAFGAQGKV